MKRADLEAALKGCLWWRDYLVERMAEISAVLSNHAPKQPRGRRAQKRKRWTPDEIKRVRALYPTTPAREIAAALARPVGQVYAAAKRVGVRKVPGSYGPEKGVCPPWLASTQFRRGHVPVNKGVRRPGWAPGRMAETQFRKGQRSGVAATNWKPVGTILPDSEGYSRIKVREAVHGAEPTGFGNLKVWPLLHRHVWEMHNGAIPNGHVVAFRNGDRSNCAIKNLELVSRTEMARRNRMFGRLPPDLVAVIQLAGQLKRTIGRLSK